MGEYSRFHCCHCGTGYTAGLATKCLECDLQKQDLDSPGPFTPPALSATTPSDTSTTFSSSVAESDFRSGSVFSSPYSKSERERQQGTVPQDNGDSSLPTRSLPATLQPGDRIPTAADFHRYLDSDPPRRAQPLQSSSVLDGQTADSREFALVWEHQVVPFLVVFLPVWLKSPPSQQLDESYSVDVFKGNKPETASIRFIHITVAQRKSLAWRVLVASSIMERLPAQYRQITKFLFFRGRVERIAACYARGTSPDRPDYTCEPTRPHFETSPSMGASVGTEGDTTTSATFGGRILLRDGDGKEFECFLTCFHPFEDGGDGATVTQPSPQEAVLLKERISSIDSLLSGCLLDHHYLLLQKERRDCEDVLESYPKRQEEMRLGSLIGCSGYRSVDCPDDPPSTDGQERLPVGVKAQVERDWAIGVICGSRSGRNLLPSDSQRFLTYLTKQQTFASINSEYPPKVCREAGRFQPGAKVYAVGRTSGLQRGRISELPTLIRFTNRPVNRVNREWVVLQDKMDDEVHWVSSGIGTPGDSGSWLLGEGGVLYGMVWGRNYSFGFHNEPRKAIFTPILDVFEDIGKVLKCDPPVLPQAVGATTPIGGIGTIDPSQLSFDPLAGLADPLATPLTQFPQELDPEYGAFNPESEALLDPSPSHFDDAYYGPARSSTKLRGRRQRFSFAVATQGQRSGRHMLPMRV
ncbi:MAG: hypothetical protein M1813_008975 [Trichoglossum hirsutum]|jgi:hypothetical protein|nr:MAG: hypothetical protein M1813_008975 [Trichoglossum hirsutum]